MFNGRGRLIGIMWGSTGGEIMAVQPGRLHLVLNRAVGASQVVVQNNPAPPPPVPELKVPQPKVAKPPDETGILPLCRRPQPAPAPAPSVVVDRDPSVGRILVSIDRKLDVVVQNTSPPAEAEKPEESGVSPLLGVLLAAGCVVLGFAVYFGAQKG